MAKSKNTSPISEIFKGIIYIILAVLMVFNIKKEFQKSFIEPPFLYDLKFEELTEGTYVQENIYAALDYFMYEETTFSKYGIKRGSFVSSYYYIIPIFTENEQELYMALEVGPTAEYAMNSICDDTYSYLLGEMHKALWKTNTYHVKGTLRNMNEEEIQYMVEWFQETEYLGTTDAGEIKSHIYPMMLQKNTGTTTRILMVASAIVILISLNKIVNSLIFWRKQKRYQPSYQYSTTSYSSSSTPLQPYQTGKTQQSGYLNQQTDYLNQQNNGYLNQQNNGYLNQQNNGYLNQQNNGYLNQQNNGYLNQQNNGYLNQQNNGYLNQQNNGYLNQQNNGYLNQQNNGYLNQQNTSQQSEVLHQQTPSKQNNSSGLSDAFFKIDNL